MSAPREVLKIRIKLHVEKSDHDGYCSDGECEYSHYTDSFLIDIPPALSYVKEGEYIDEVDELNHEIIPYERRVKWMMGEGNGYCGLSDKSIKKGLRGHDCRVTLVNAKVVSKLD